MKTFISFGVKMSISKIFIVHPISMLWNFDKISINTVKYYSTYRYAVEF